MKKVTVKITRTAAPEIIEPITAEAAASQITALRLRHLDLSKSLEGRVSPERKAALQKTLKEVQAEIDTLIRRVNG